MIIGGPILGAIVLIAALVVLADTLNKYANGEAPTGTSPSPPSTAYPA